MRGDLSDASIRVGGKVDIEGHSTMLVVLTPEVLKSEV